MSGRKRQLTASENVMQEAASVLAQFKSRRTEVPVTVPVKEDDDDDIFGKHVASEMRKMKDPRAKGLARVRIQSVLFGAQFSAPPPPTVIQQGGYTNGGHSGQCCQSGPSRYTTN